MAATSSRTRRTQFLNRGRSLFLERLEQRTLLAAVITVNSADDADTRDTVLTLREAIEVNNRTLAVAALTAAEQAQVVGAPTSGDADTIQFNVPGTGVHTITPAAGQLPFITDAVTIDGYTQPGASANTNGPGLADNANLLIEISGSVLTNNGNGLTITNTASGSTIRGLVIDSGWGSGVLVQATNTVIEGCFIGTDSTGLIAHGVSIGVGSSFGADTSGSRIGGSTPAARNIISGNGTGVLINNSNGSGHLVQGNFIGLDATGAAALANGTGVDLRSSNDTVGGTTPAERNVIAGFSGTGIVTDPLSSGSLIEGNFIGTDVTGTVGLGLVTAMRLDGAATIGGPTSTPGTGAGNVINASQTGFSGGNGIVIPLNVNNCVIQGNLIGTDVTGTKEIGFTQDAIQVFGSLNTIGSDGDGVNDDEEGNVISGAGLRGILLGNNNASIHDNAIRGNVITGNGTTGVVLTDSVRTAVLGNSIFDNGGLGIDLNGDGVTPNDPGDGDSGVNNLQNFPVLTSAVINGPTTTITGTFNSTPNSTFRIEFFANLDPDPSLHGEGQTFVGFTNVTTDAGGDASISFSPATALVEGFQVSSTATKLEDTDQNGQTPPVPTDTSEFSNDICVAGPFTVVNTNDSGPGSLRQIILDTNAHANSLNPGGVPDIITFCIEGSGVHTISPLTALPSIADPVQIDGYSQPGAAPNTNPNAFNGTLLIALDGTSSGGSAGLVISAGNSTVRGLVINRFGSDGIQINAGGGNVIKGNIIGTDALSSASLGNVNGIVTNGAGGNTIGGTSPDARNIISGNNNSGLQLQGQSGDTLKGNFIGTDLAGTQPLGNTVDGVNLRFGVGSNTVSGNVISANHRAGVVIESSETNNLIQGNFIGTDLTGTAALGNADRGVVITTGSNNTVSGNVIAHNALDGVGISAASSTANSILGNSIFANAGLGIDLGLDGVTPNDESAFPFDTDTGPNNLQNFPALTSATSSNGTTTIQGTLKSIENTTFRIEFFASAAADPSGNGEGQTFLGFTNATTNASGVATFSFQTPTPTGTFFTATATRTNGEDVLFDTSEFSAVFPPLQVSSVDLAVAKTDSPDPVIAGTNLTYTVTLSNAGAGNAQNVVLSDAIPANTTFVSFTALTGASGPAFILSTPPVGGTGTLTATIDTFPTGETDTFALVVKVNANMPETGIINNTVTVSSDAQEEIVANNTDTESTTVIQRPDLSVTKSDSPDPVTAGNNLTYTITLSNAGPSDAASATLTDVIPANTTFVSAAQTSGPTFTLSNPPNPPVGGTGTFTAVIGSFAAGASATFTLVVNVTAGTAQGTTISNTAVASSATTDANSGNNDATATTTVNAPAVNTDLQVTKSDSPDPVVAGTNLTYTLTVTNAGTNAAQTVSLSDTLPANTTFVSASQTSGPGFTISPFTVGGAGTFSASAATLTASATATFSLVIHVTASLLPGTTISNTATVSSTTADSNTANNSSTATTTVNAQADVAISKTGPATVTAGSNLTYTIAVSSGGPSDAQGVSLSDLLPANTTFVSLASPSGWTNSTPAVGATGTITSTRPTLTSAAGVQIFTLVVHANASAPAGSTLSNAVTVTSTTADSNTANNAATATTTVSTAADVAITKTDHPDPITAGGTLTYTITVSNNGPSDAHGVMLSDVIPAGTTFVSAAQHSGTAFTLTPPAVGGSGTVTAIASSVAPGAGAVFTLVVQVGSGAENGTTISNTATVSASTTDSNSGNNSATSTTSVGRAGLPECDIATLNAPGAARSAVLQGDAENPEQNVLLVTGTSRNDVIVIEPRPQNPAQIRVKFNGATVSIVNASDVQRIVAFGLSGNDTIIVNARLLQSATLVGGSGNDFLYGGAGNDQISGGAGNDHLFGLAGNDALCGDDGNDFLFGGLGNDTLFGEAGNDRLFGENGDDLLLAGDGNDFAFGGIGNDQLFGQAGNDQLFGESGNDIVVGGDGNDKLFGSTGRDLLIGGSGADQLFGETHDDILIAGSTAFDEAPDALSAILAEWTSSNDYFTRINHLRTGGGATGGFTLDDTTVLDDGAIDTLWGHGGQDWFLIGSRDKLKDRAAGELVN